MPNPISSLTRNDSANACLNDDAEPNACVSPAAQASAPPLSLSPSADDANGTCSSPSAVPDLVAKFSTPPWPKSPTGTASAAAGSPGAAGTSPAGSPVSLSTRFLVASAGRAPGSGSVRVAGSLLEQEFSAGPCKTKLEVGAVSAAYGKDNDAQVTLLRRTTTLTHAGYGLTVTGEALSARGNLGETNDDGSIGGNIGSGAQLLGTEATIDTPYGSLTGGVSISASLSGSLGVRDADHDGEPEFCAKVSLPVGTFGACVEQFW